MGRREIDKQISPQNWIGREPPEMARMLEFLARMIARRHLNKQRTADQPKQPKPTRSIKRKL